MSSAGPSRITGTIPQGEAVNSDGSLKEASELSWAYDPDDEDAVPLVAPEEYIQPTRTFHEAGRSTGTIPQGEAVNADGTLKEAWQLTWAYDPDEDASIPLTTVSDGDANKNRSCRARQKKRTKVDVGMFLDTEAAVNGSSDESDESTDGEFIDDAGGDENHSQPGMTLLTAMEAESNFLESLITKYVENGTVAQAQTSSPLDPVWPTWQVPVTVGFEAVAVFRILRRCQEGFCISHNAPRSAFFKPSIPGRIFVEVLRHEDARFICKDILGVRTNRIATRPLKSETAIEYLSRIPAPEMLTTGCWVRLNRAPYKNDLALVTGVNDNRSTVNVVAVPRVSYSKGSGKRRRGQRPPQALFDVAKCESSFGKRSITTIFGPTGSDVIGRRFKNHVFDRSGYLVLKDLPTEHYTMVERASRSECMAFSKCNAVSPSTLHSAVKILANRSLRRSEKVRILDGTFRGFVGTVEDVHLHHVNVTLPETVYDGLLDLPLMGVTRYFAVGDHVVVKSGERKGTQGYVVSTENMSDCITIHILKPQVSELVASVDDVQAMPHDLSLVMPRTIAQKLPNQRDTNLQRYVNSKVILQTAPFKGYGGVIRSINADGVADIELDTFSAVGIQMTQCHVLQLYFILEEDKRLYEIHSETTYDLVITNLSIPPRKAPTPEPRSRTPTVESTEMSTSGDPGWTIQEGEAKRHWIRVVQPAMSKLRKIAVRVTAQCDEPDLQGRTGFMKEVVGNKVQVFLSPLVNGQQGEHREIDYSFLTYVPPTKANQSVVVVEAGGDQGSIHTVINRPAEYTDLGAARGRHKFVKTKEIRTDGLATFH